MGRKYRWLAVLLIVFAFFISSCTKELQSSVIDKIPPEGILVRMPELPPGLFYIHPCELKLLTVGLVGVCFIGYEGKVGIGMTEYESCLLLVSPLYWRTSDRIGYWDYA